MSNSKEVDKIGLVVPVHVDAYCVGTKDKTDSKGYAGATSNYPSVNKETEKFLWSSLSIELDRTPVHPLKKGIHLHWALPDALTKAKVDEEGQLVFPTVPNRWLVVRMIDQDNKPPTVKSWIVESDYVWQEPPEDRSHTSIRNILNKDNVPAAYIGRLVEIGDFIESDGDRLTLKSEMGSGLTAVTSGTVSFASYYPDCQSVFGFHDSLEGVKSGKITYSVIGWYSDSKDDPLKEVKITSSAELEKAFKWHFEKSEENPTFSTYSGSVQNIDWNEEKIYGTDEDPIRADISVGNHPIEALSAYLHDQDLSHSGGLYEPILHAIQSGDFPTLQEDPDLIKELLEKGLQNAFSTHPGGFCFAIGVESSDGGEKKEIEDLPLRLAERLNELNRTQSEFDRLEAYLKSAQSQLFAVWRHTFATKGRSIQEAHNRCDTIKGILKEQESTKSQRDTLKQAILDALEKNQILIEKPATLYKQPNEPVVALSIEDDRKGDLLFPERFGGDGRYSDQGLLLCRTSLQCVTRTSLGPLSISLPPQINLNFKKLTFGQLFEVLVAEAYLMSFKSVSEAVAKGGEFIAPSPISLTPWEGKNPWHPLFLQWNVSFYPYLNTFQDHKFINYSPTFFTDNFEVDPEEVGLIKVKKDPVIREDRKQPYIGHSLLSPRPKEALLVGLSGYLDKNENAVEVQTLAQKLEKSQVLVQPLSGFNNALLQRPQSIQIKPEAIQLLDKSKFSEAAKEVTKEVSKYVGDMTGLGVSFFESFNPIRTGAFRLSLEIVDIFGKKRAVEPKKTPSIYAHSMGRTKEENAAFLPPRIIQPARLTFEWVGKEQLEESEMNIGVESDPVCGWILPNHLAKELFLYNAQGEALGILPLHGTPKVFPGKFQNKTFDQVLEEQHPLLRDIVKQIQSNQNLDQILGRLEKRSSLIQAGLQSSRGNIAQLIGNPVAIVQAAVRLEIQGMLAINQSLDCYPVNDYYHLTNHEVSKIQFPLILEDDKRVNDGLVAYFKEKEKGKYDLKEIAPNLIVNAQPSDALKPPQRILMFVDPRVPVHAITGILPTEQLILRPSWTQKALERLETAFFTSPLLKTIEGLKLHLPEEEGYSFSYLEGGSKLDPLLDSTPEDGTSSYSPQSISEGWLRLNPTNLEFSFKNAQGQPLLYPDQPLSLFIKNRTHSEISLTPGKAQKETAPEKEGTLIYLHLGKQIELVEQTENDWEIKSLDSKRYGKYWQLILKKGTAIKPNESINFPIKLTTNEIEKISQVDLSFDYYNIVGVEDGVFHNIITVQI